MVALVLLVALVGLPGGGGCAWAPHIKVLTQHVEFSTARGVTC